MGKRVFFLAIVVVAVGLAWFVLDVNVAEMKALAGPYETKNASHFPSSAGTMCAEEADTQGPACLEMERKILATTLRIEIRTWIIYIEGQGYTTLSSNGHGTVVGDRYFLTHNHFDLPLLQLLSDGKDGEFAEVNLYAAEGELLWQGSLTTAAVALDDSETLLLEFEDRNGNGLFETLGLPSAEFAAGEVATLTVGTEGAQINWDESQAQVQWATVQGTLTERGTPIVRLDDCLVPGASGGGVFVGGIHVANNWSRSVGCGETDIGEAVKHSTAALNSAELVAAIR
jgi:hypothetical protein